MHEVHVTVVEHLPVTTAARTVFDLAGVLYVATYGAGLVTVMDPEGRIIRTVKLPGTDVTNVEFSGKDLKTLYITEAQKGEVFKMEVEIGGLPLFRAPKNEVQ